MHMGIHTVLSTFEKNFRMIFVSRISEFVLYTCGEGVGSKEKELLQRSKIKHILMKILSFWGMNLKFGILVYNQGQLLFKIMLSFV